MSDLSELRDEDEFVLVRGGEVVGLLVAGCGVENATLGWRSFRRGGGGGLDELEGDIMSWWDEVVLWLHVSACVGGVVAHMNMSFDSLISPRISSDTAAIICADGNPSMMTANWSILACMSANSCVVRADCSVVGGTGCA